jgi:Na+/proline symporter
MSTISTQLNWGSSYIVYDFYKQQINPKASEKRLVTVGRISTVVLMVFSAFLALLLQNALQLFEVLLVFGAGTGLIFILRWFWWRINAWSEITAMFASGIISIILKLTPVGNYLFAPDSGVFEDYYEYPFVVFITTFIWLTATYITQPESSKVLQNFYKKIQPGGPGWAKVIEEASNEGIEIKEMDTGWSVPSGMIAMLLGCLLIYSCMFATGYWIYGDYNYAISLTITAVISGVLLIKVWNKIKTTIL